ncbi:MAG: bifunctional folylpolyglutamate synthase/dihydrofolate synthase, partial [Clostridiales bacterium]|nr:bifunctional folylpolyglutamate synthase/dihydrofolate synthase [Clostridiales bacterium]
TVSKIAGEKCGIIKNGGITITSPNQDSAALKVIRLAASKRDNALFVPDLNDLVVKGSDLFGTDIVYKGIPIHIPVGGAHQIENASVSAECALRLKARGIKLSDKDISRGIGASALPARTEVLARRPLVILDGGHNASGIAALAGLLGGYLKTAQHGKVYAVCGMMADKDYMRWVGFIAPL